MRGQNIGAVYARERGCILPLDTIYDGVRYTVVALQPEILCFTVKRAETVNYPV